MSGFGASHSERIRPYVTIDFSGIRALIDAPPSVDKLQAQWMIPSTLLTRTFQEQEQDGQFWLLWADLDEAPLPLDAIATLIKPLDCDYEIYTSRSATIENPKCRILIPLANALTGSEWRLAQEVLNDILQAGGAIPDRANERCGQLCFLPNRGQFYDVRSRRLGECFDPLVFWADLIEAKRDTLLEAERVVRERREQAQVRKANLSPRTTPSLIDAFNQTYPVEEILLCAGYAQRGAHFRHLNSQSGSYSASVKDGRVHTLSTSDPLYSDGQGAHDAFSAFSVLFAGGDTAKALKLAGDEWLRIGDESWNAVQRREYAIAHAPEPMDFETLFKNECERAQRLLTGEEPQPQETLVATDKPSEEVFFLDRYVLNGKSAEIEAQMLEDKFVLEGIAIYGQFTVIYAPPNAGKTLITYHLIIQAITEGVIDAPQIYYINADDNGAGGLAKLKIAEQHHFNYISTNYADFKTEGFTRDLLKNIQTSSPREKIIILDTVKKFTDIMNKSAVSNFNKAIRTFVQDGGTVILLAHVNKHRDSEDKVIFAGTSDLLDDADCVFTLDTAKQSNGIHLATFENKKARGDVDTSLAFQFTRWKGQTYEELLGAVKSINENEIEQSLLASQIDQSGQANRELITVLIDLMNEGLTIKGELVKEAVKRAEVSKDRVGDVLRIHTGDALLSGHYWTMTVGEKNAKLFTLLKEYQKPLKAHSQDKATNLPQQIILSANAASTANSISTGLLTIGLYPQTAANTANSYLQLMGVVGDGWRASP